MRSIAILFALLGLVACNNPAPPAVDGGGGNDSGGAADAGVDATDDPDSGPTDLPDITIDSDYLASNLQFARQYFPADACEIAEACVGGPGWRTLLMFTTFTPNIGTADLNLGPNLLPGGDVNPIYEYSTCHMHYHFRGYADYSLLNLDGTVAAMGHKQSFCVEDLQQVDFSAATSDSPHFGNCGFAGGEQGIQHGWADDYYPDLPCQWIDVTDVAPGTYTLQVEINGLHNIVESDYTNDIGTAMVTIPASFAGVDSTRACTSADPYQGIGRNCGWHREGVHTCTPGDALSVGCNAACGVGSCDGDSTHGYSWDVRICDGDLNCDSADSVGLIQQDFGECGSGIFDLSSSCGVARFECPASGMYTVLVANDYADSANPLTYCHLATVVGP